MQHAKINPSNWNETIRSLVAGQCDIITLTTPSTSLLELQIPHGLGRMPKGWSVITGDAATGGTTAYTPAGTISQITPAGSVTLTPSTASRTVPVRYLYEWYFDSNTFINSSVETSMQNNDRGQVANMPQLEIPVIRAASITGMGCVVSCDTANSANSVITFRSKVNGTTKLTLASPTLASNNTFYKATTTAAVGTYPCAANDLLTMTYQFAYTTTAAECPNVRVWLEMTSTETVSGNDTTYTAAFTGTPVTPTFTGTPGSVNLVKSVTAGPTAWDNNFIYLKFVATSAPITLAVW